MNKNGASGPYLPRQLPAALAGLVRLALDLRWSWHHGSDVLWRSVDAITWESTHNAWLVLVCVSGDKLDQLAEDELFLDLLRCQLTAHAEYASRTTWFDSTYPAHQASPVAYFCMEYGLSESLPLYSGGLGVLAGDYLKAANDLGVPVVAVGLLYQQGYFRQSINTDGEQLEFYPYNDPTMLPLSPLRDDNDEWVRVVIGFPGREVRLRAWRGQVGRCELLLLDSNDPRNEPGDRGITSELYSADPEKRLQQEMVLGIGGWRLLEQMNIQPAICHLNEGHCALALLERIRCYQQRTGAGFSRARFDLRPGNLFTTHTSVASGFDHYPAHLVSLYLGDYLQEMGSSVLQLMTLDASVERREEKTLNMAWLAIQLSGRVNAVSEIHQQVSRQLFRPLFPRWPDADIPIDVVTNGVHTPSWDAPESDELWTRACGKNRWCESLDQTPEPMAPIPDESLWTMRNTQRKRLIGFVRTRLASQHCEHGSPGSASAACGLLLDDEALTIGFARRFTAYKRPDLLLADEPRLIRLLNNRDRPLQIVLSGKAHPKDSTGKALIKRWKMFIRRPDVQGRVVFIDDYDLRVAARMVQGVDVWLNSPRHPWEACGTSGMKVLVNGGLNLSQYDGWWAEAWNPDVGWAVRPSARPEELGHSPERDRQDADELFEILESRVIPEFYDCDPAGLPRTWLARVRASMDQLTPRYSANRMVRDYVEQFYLPMNAALERRAETDPATTLKDLRRVNEHWSMLRFGGMDIEPSGKDYLISVQVHLDEIEPSLLRIELIADASSHGARRVIRMDHVATLAGSASGHTYQCTAPGDRPVDHYTPRIIPESRKLSVPLENNAIHWLC